MANKIQVQSLGIPKATKAKPKRKPLLNPNARVRVCFKRIGPSAWDTWLLAALEGKAIAAHYDGSKGVGYVLCYQADEQDVRNIILSYGDISEC